MKDYEDMTDDEIAELYMSEDDPGYHPLPPPPARPRIGGTPKASDAPIGKPRYWVMWAVLDEGRTMIVDTRVDFECPGPGFIDADSEENRKIQDVRLLEQIAYVESGKTYVNKAMREHLEVMRERARKKGLIPPAAS